MTRYCRWKIRKSGEIRGVHLGMKIHRNSKAHSPSFCPSMDARLSFQLMIIGTVVGVETSSLVLVIESLILCVGISFRQNVGYLGGYMAKVNFTELSKIPFRGRMGKE